MKMKLKVLLVILSYVGIPSVCLSMLEDREDMSFSKHPLVRKVFREEAEFRTATGQNIADILSTVTAMYEENDLWDPKKLQEKILEGMQTDLDLLAILNSKIKTLNPGTEVSYPLLYNKMTEAITGARDNLIRKPCFFDLLDGKVPQGYAYRDHRITRLAPNEETIYGDSKGTFLKTALFYIFHLFHSSIHPSRFEKMRLALANTSPSYHMTPLPEKFNYDQFIALDPRFSKFPYFVRGDQAWPCGYFFYAHSGYAFGGDDNNPHFPEGKLYGPEDCSSAMSKWLQAQARVRFTTLDQLYGYRYYLPEKESSVSSDWPQSHLGEYFKTLKPVVIYDPSRDIKEGQIQALRKFSLSNEDPNMTKSAGIGGHTMLVVGTTQDNMVLSLSYARDMPTYEGFGLKTFPYESRFPQKIMFFGSDAKI